jgi:hypothetical protein
MATRSAPSWHTRLPRAISECHAGLVRPSLAIEELSAIMATNATSPAIPRRRAACPLANSESDSNGTSASKNIDAVIPQRISGRPRASGGAS